MIGGEHPSDKKNLRFAEISKNNKLTNISS
jgi:hypothetical protein